MSEREVLTPRERAEVERILGRLSVTGWIAKAMRIALARGDGPTSEGGAPVTLPDASQVQTLLSPAPPTALPELVAAAERIRAAWRQVYPGGCKMLSRGDACVCVLCDVDRLLAALAGRSEAIPTVAELKAALLKVPRVYGYNFRDVEAEVIARTLAPLLAASRGGAPTKDALSECPAPPGNCVSQDGETHGRCWAPQAERKD